MHVLHLEGGFDGLSLHVPTAPGGVVNFTAEVSRLTSVGASESVAPATSDPKITTHAWGAPS